MLAILNSLNAHNFPIFQPILMKLAAAKFMVHRALFDKTYLSLGLLSPLKSVANVSWLFHSWQADDQADLSFCWAPRSVWWFCHVLTQILNVL